MSNGPRRILLTTDVVGGVWTYSLELAEALGPHRVQVLLAALGQPSADQRSEAERIPNVQLLSGDYKLEWMEDPWDDVEASGEWLLGLERQFQPDVVHMNSYGHGALPWSAPAVVTAHSCVLSWWRAVRGEAAPAQWDRYRATVQRSLEAAAVVTAPSRAMADTLAVNYGIRDCRVIRNGRWSGRFCCGPKEPFILSAGRVWDEAKNLAPVARLADRLRWPVYIAGEARNFEVLGARMVGRLPAGELSNWYSRASLYVLPARYEPFGLSALEAALSGCALVLGDIPSLREVWQDAAVFVPPDDAGMLQAALERLIADPAARAEWAQRARQRARLFTPERMAAQYLAVYETLSRQRSFACVS